jgi:hypothetical protein
VLNEKEATEDAATETVHGGSSAEAVDVEIVRIVKEKESVSDALDDSTVVRNGASNDAEDAEGVEV